VLTLHKDYFRLSRPIERRVYEIARKHCGSQDSWKISIELRKLKCGSRAPLKGFRHDSRQLAKGDHLPDYCVSVDDQDFVTCQNRSSLKTAPASSQTVFLRLNPETYHDARTVAPRYDVYFLEQEWRRYWIESGQPELKDPDAAFIGFCRNRHEKNPNP
jgi:hypothetical protein